MQPEVATEPTPARRALLSAATVEHGTPEHIVELGREVLGGAIECDAASSAYWNRWVVKARAYFDEERSALSPEFERLWTMVNGAPLYSTFSINPPGGLVKEFWRFGTHRWLEGSAVFWVGFSLEQMGYLSRAGLMWPGFRRAVLPKRLAFLQRRRDAIAAALEKADAAAKKGDLGTAARLTARAGGLALDPDGPPVPATAPTHSNYLALLPSDGAQVERFDAGVRALGAEPF